MGRGKRARISRTYPTEGFIAEDVQRLRPDTGESKRLTHRRGERLKRSVPMPRNIDLPSTATMFFLLLRTGTGAHAPPAVGARDLLPRASISHPRYRPAFAWPTPSRQITSTPQVQYHGGQFVSQPKLQPPGGRPRRGIIQATGVNGRCISDTTGKEAPNSRQQILLHREAVPMVERPRVKAPVDLPQPAQLLQLPLGEPVREANNILPRESKPNPFAAPDITYKDSWLDYLWIGLFGSRMSAAVEAEARRVAEEPGYPGLVSLPSLENRDSVGLEVSGDSECEGGGSERGVIGTGMRRGSGRYTYEDYVELASMLQSGAPERQRQVVRGVLRSIFPSWFPAFYRTLFPFSKFSAQVNAFMCPPLFSWLVGKSHVTDGIVDLKGVGGTGPSQEVWKSMVKVERCRYLEASKCKGTCMNLCKLPTEAFFQEELGMPLRMTPNFEDLSCEFAFGQAAAPADEDPLMKEPCWKECLKSGKQLKAPQRPCHTMPESPLKG